MAGEHQGTGNRTGLRVYLGRFFLGRSGTGTTLTMMMMMKALQTRTWREAMAPTLTIMVEEGADLLKSPSQSWVPMTAMGQDHLALDRLHQVQQDLH